MIPDVPVTTAFTLKGRGPAGPLPFYRNRVSVLSSLMGLCQRMAAMRSEAPVVGWVGTQNFFPRQIAILLVPSGASPAPRPGVFRGLRAPVPRGSLSLI